MALQARRMISARDGALTLDCFPLPGVGSAPITRSVIRIVAICVSVVCPASECPVSKIDGVTLSGCFVSGSRLRRERKHGNCRLALVQATLSAIIFKPAMSASSIFPYPTLINPASSKFERWWLMVLRVRPIISPNSSWLTLMTCRSVVWI